MKYRGIAISGKAAAGKDSVGEAIIEGLLNQWTPARIVKLATPIYEEAINIYGMDPNKKNRPLLQRIGTDRVKQDPAFYPRKLMQSLHDYDVTARAERVVDAQRGIHYVMDYESPIAVVTDLRKVIEAEYLRQQGFALLRLDVDPKVQEHRLLTRDGEYNAEHLRHWTEVDLDHYAYFDMRIPNNGLLTPQEIAWFVLRGLDMEIGPHVDERKEAVRLA